MEWKEKICTLITRRFVILMLIILLYVVVSTYILLMKKPIDQDTFYYFLIALQTLIMAFSLGYVIIQVHSLKKSYQFNIMRPKIETAVGLAQFYAESVVPKIDYLKTLYNISGLSSFIKEKIKSRKICNFNKREIDCHDLKDALAEYGDMEEKIKVETYIHALSNTNFTFPPPNEFQDTADIAWFYNNTQRLKVELLNSLEWFAMHFNTGIADNDTVYQSLHQGYLETINLLYFDICRHNSGHEKDAYYINVISLYNRWIKIDSDLETKEKTKIENIKNQQKENDCTITPTKIPE